MQSAVKGKESCAHLAPPNPSATRKILLALICLIGLAAVPAQAQNITLSVKETPLEKVLQQISAQSAHQLVYTFETMQKAKPVTVSLKETPLEKALELVFRNQPLSFKVNDGHIIVKGKEEEKPIQPQRELTGLVTGPEDKPVPGATVAVKGGAQATATDKDGRFVLSGVAPDATIRITSVGYQPVEVALHNRSYIEVHLSMSVSALDETVVIAYGTTTRRFNTGSVSKVSGEEIRKQPVSNPLAALEGRMPGVFVTETSGLPGSRINLMIRGRNSIGAGNEPLYIVDGVPFTSTPLNGTLVHFNGANGQVSPFSSINPADIESIEVLKDADATAIYGSRGANGVVLITTRKALSSKTKFTFNGYTGVSKVSQFLDYLNTPQYLQLRREAFAHDGVVPTLNDAPDLLQWDSTAYTDWARYLMGGTAQVTDMQASISGGNATTHFLLSGSYHKEGTVLPGDFGYRRSGARLQFGHVSENKKFSTTVGVYYTTDYNRLIKSGLTTFIELPPNFPLYDDNGKLNWNGGDNPEAYLKRLSKSKTENLISNASFQYNLLHGLELRLNAGYSSIAMNQVLTMPLLSQQPRASAKNSAYFGNNRVTTYQLEPMLDYTATTRNGKIKMLLGSTWNQSVSDGSYLQGDNYVNESFLESISAAGVISSRYDQYADYKYFSVFGRFNYTHNGRYLLNASFRRDGSSRFGPGKEWGNFGALGLGWIFSQASFVKTNLPWISFGKLRTSYGVTGNDQISDYQYLLTYGSGPVYNGSGTLGPSRIENPEYSWESNHKLEAALELGLFKDHLMFTTAWYRNRSGNLLVPFPLPGQSGFTSYQANLPGLVQNTGWEISAQYNNAAERKVQWSASFNITVPNNELLEYPDLASSVYANTYVIGQDLSINKGFHFLGVDPQNGLAQFADINGDEQITYPEDLIIIGKASPEFYGGLQNSLAYKNLQLDVSLQFVKQMGLGYVPAAGSMNNNHITALNRWRQSGDLTNVPRPSADFSNPAYLNNIYMVLSDAAFGSATYLRFKSLAISYKLPTSMLQKMKLDECKFYVQGQNLLTVTSYKQLDPENQGSNVPPLKTITAGIQITF